MFIIHHKYTKDVEYCCKVIFFSHIISRVTCDILFIKEEMPSAKKGIRTQWSTKRSCITLQNTFWKWFYVWFDTFCLYFSNGLLYVCSVLMWFLTGQFSSLNWKIQSGKNKCWISLRVTKTLGIHSVYETVLHMIINVAKNTLKWENWFLSVSECIFT